MITPVAPKINMPIMPVVKTPSKETPAQLTPMHSYANVPVFYPFAPIMSNQYQDLAIKSAMEHLEEVKFNPYDVMYLENMGARIRFRSGKEAADFLKRKKVSIVFAPVDNPKIHAQWTKSRNTIVINEKYRNTRNLDEILAISAAISHEAGHALDDDYSTSIQEEIDCLALNTLVNRFHDMKYPSAIVTDKNSDIIDDGVRLYTKLFFDPDITKQALIRRVSEKYGELPVESENHRAQILALKIKEYYLNG